MSSLSNFFACGTCPPLWAKINGLFVRAANTGVSDCPSCAAGKYSSTSGSTGCTSCFGGTYSSTTGASSAAACSNCPANFYSGSAASACTSCPAGQSSSAGASSCETSGCDAGEFEDVGGDCHDCPSGQYQVSSSLQEKLDRSCGAVACTELRTAAIASFKNPLGKTSNCILFFTGGVWLHGRRVLAVRRGAVCALRSQHGVLHMQPGHLRGLDRHHQVLLLPLGHLR
jgi:hypothetical protein